MRRRRWPPSARKEGNYSIGGWRTRAIVRAFFTVPRHQLAFGTTSHRSMRLPEPRPRAPRTTTLLCTALLVPALLAACRTVERRAASARPEADRLQRDIAYLADDRLEGRGTGTAGNDSAASWLGRRHAALGLKPVVVDTTGSVCSAVRQRPGC